MNTSIPAWALRPATPHDLDAIRAIHRKGSLLITLPDQKALRAWAKDHGWPTPWFDFEKAFTNKLLEDQASFEQALSDSGVHIQLPLKEYTITTKRIAELDNLYTAVSPSRQALHWNTLVGELREIRHAIEGGVIIRIEGGPTLRSWQSFYSWAHGRYHMLEDGADEWIGMD